MNVTKSRAGRTLLGIACFVLAVAVAPAAFTQFLFALGISPQMTAALAGGAPPDNAPPPPGGPGRGNFGFRVITGAPYSAVRTTTHVETLADGSTITRTNVVKESRDSEGRTYSESKSENGDFVSYRVFDPVAHESITWSSRNKEAHVMHLPDPSQFRGRGPAADASGNAPGPRPGEAAGGFRRNGVQPDVKSLGGASVAGVYAEGTRITRTIPAGKIGNSEPLVSTHESWLSPDLKIEVKRVDSDPRNGTTTMVLSDINRGEPDVSLFQVPEGYTVKEQTGRGGPRPQFGPPGGPGPRP